MAPFKFHCIKVTEHNIARAGRAYDTYREAAALAEVMIEREPDEEAEIMVVDDLELAALSVGMRYVGDGLD